ncbi:hypothetical protein BC629DRAFT_1597109 [Irpex lacteus]|nr:hypothetical protein BC629DRAFT_1597109 [Irpex lacteus]
MDLGTVDSVLALLDKDSVAQFLYTFLHNSRYDGSNAKQDFLSQWPALLEHLAVHPLLQVKTENFAVALVTGKLKTEVATIAEKESGWHFSAKHVHVARTPPPQLRLRVGIGWTRERMGLRKRNG